MKVCAHNNTLLTFSKTWREAQVVQRTQSGRSWTMQVCRFKRNSEETNSLIFRLQVLSCEVQVTLGALSVGSQNVRHPQTDTGWRTVCRVYRSYSCLKLFNNHSLCLSYSNNLVWKWGTVSTTKWTTNTLCSSCEECNHHGQFWQHPLPSEAFIPPVSEWGNGESVCSTCLRMGQCPSHLSQNGAMEKVSIPPVSE